MFDNLLSMRHAAPRAAAPTTRVTRKLEAVLAELPASWRVLRNRRATAADGPPWVKYIALHSEKGIALIDLLPNNPHAAIAPLDEFLGRTGYDAFSRGDPPIVAIALAERDIAAISDHLADAFADMRPCGIKNANWPEAVIELLMSTPGLLLTPIAKATDTPKQRNAASADQKSPVYERPPRSEPSSPPRKAPQPEPAAPSDVLKAREPSQPPEPRAVPLAVPDPELRVGHASEVKHDRSPRKAPRPEPAAPSDPLNAREPSQPPEPRAVPLEAPDPEFRVGHASEVEHDRPPRYSMMASDPDFRVGHSTEFHHETRRRRPLVLWLTAASLCAGAAIGFLYLHSPVTPPDTTAKLDDAPTQVVDLPKFSADTAATDKEQHATIPPANPVVSPPAPIAPPQPSVAPKAPGPDAASPISPDARTPDKPDRLAIQKPAKVQPAPAPAGVGSTPSGERKVREAHAKLQLNPPPDLTDGDLSPSPAGEETITIDGTTYIRGREPKALGTVTEPQPESEPGFIPDN
jgi:hypothetical protein